MWRTLSGVKLFSRWNEAIIMFYYSHSRTLSLYREVENEVHTHFVVVTLKNEEVLIHTIANCESCFWKFLNNSVVAVVVVVVDVGVVVAVVDVDVSTSETSKRLQQSDLSNWNAFKTLCTEERREKGRECVRERKRACVWVCVCERERERTWVLIGKESMSQHKEASERKRRS